MSTSATPSVVTVAALATAATLAAEPSPRLAGWQPKSTKTRKERAAHKRRQKIAKASRRRNR